jgi:hypothetical protein
MRNENSHEVYFEVRGDHLVVVYQGIGTNYVEVLDLATGKQRRRWTYPAW